MKLEYKKIVNALLENVPDTRGDDFLLLAEYIRETVNENDPNFLEKLRAAEFIEHWRELKLPNIDSVWRARRKAQEDNPLLRDPLAHKRRRAAELDYRREYSRSEREQR